MKGHTLYDTCGRIQACYRRENGNLRVTLLRCNIERIERLLLMRNEHLLRPVHNKIAAVIVLAFAGLFQEDLWLGVEKTIAAVEHNRNTEYGKFGQITVSSVLGRIQDYLCCREPAPVVIRSGIGNTHNNVGLHLCGIGQITQPRLIWKEQTNLFGIL